tara:strand:- start:3365 stop:4660 length:1296 start_codon:yes stop_codon:yes gene_type:complete
MSKRKIICIIMGGGRGTRLNPLTQVRCKPAVPLAGKYRLVDIPISNCLNSGYNQIFVLTQFNTASLHRHIQESYKFDPFGGGFVDILSAEQTEKSDDWYQGTADAVRQNLHHFGATNDSDLCIILSGDQLFRMNLNDLVSEHLSHGADVSIAAKPLSLNEAGGLGLMRVNEQLQITEFVEKPKDPKVIQSLSVGPEVKTKMQDPGSEEYCLASMGIYVFKASVLNEALKNDMRDFGKEVIPSLLGSKHLHSYIFDDYWEDIGTVKAFFECNLGLTDVQPPFNFYNEDNRIYTRARYLPAVKLNGAQTFQTVIADGSIINHAKLHRVLMGVRSIVGQDSTLENVVMMGSDSFEDENDLKENHTKGRPNIGVGENCFIKNAILDKNVRIGNHVVLDPTGLEDNFKPGLDVSIRDGVLIVSKDAILPDGYHLKA